MAVALSAVYFIGCIVALCVIARADVDVEDRGVIVLCVIWPVLLVMIVVFLVLEAVFDRKKED